MHYSIYFFFILPFAISCRNYNDLSAQDIVNKTIEISGGHKYLNTEIQFDFRNKRYQSFRYEGQFQYERHFKDSLGVIRDILSNDGFKRFINDEVAKIPDSMAIKYASSVNSVHYFALLPFGLNDEAVNKTQLDEVQIKNNKYYKIKVWFNEKGGGEDFEDVFIYWINKQTYKVDYLAYSYMEENGIGMRFREAYNERYNNGLRFVDYHNYMTKDPNRTLFNLDAAFQEDELILISKIELQNILVN